MRESVLEMERVRSERAEAAEGTPSQQQRMQQREFARQAVARLMDAYYGLFDALCTPDAMERFIFWRIRIVDREVPALDFDEVEQVRAIGTRLAHELASTLKERMLVIPTQELIDQRLYWVSADVWKPVPVAFERACEPLSMAIAQEIIAKTLRMHAQSLPGCVGSAGLAAAHTLLDPGRRPPHDLTKALKAQAAIIDAASWVNSATLRTAAAGDN